MTNILSTIFCIVAGIECIVILFTFILNMLFLISTDISTEKRRVNQEKRDIEYHKARMKEMIK